MSEQPEAVPIVHPDVPRDVLPPLPARAVATVNRTRNNHNQLVNIRDRLFHSLFYRGSLAYARAFSKSARRLIEFVVLVNAFAALFMLVYIHMSFARTANTCLDSAIYNWPKDGILRVEIIRNMDKDYTLEDSYAKEERLNRWRNNELNGLFGYLNTRLEVESSTEEHANNKETEPLKASTGTIRSAPTSTKHGQCFAGELLNVSSIAREKVDTFTEMPNDTTTPAPTFWDKLQRTIYKGTEEESSDKNSKILADKRLMEKGEIYIVEYSLEYGFLRLSPATRDKLNITVKAVFLDPDKDPCFGDFFSRFLLDEFLGYNDLLMNSVKSFAEKEHNRGYMKNVVSGEHYRFINLWMARSAYIPALMCMLIFTVIVSMLLRYAHHQIFVFIVDFLQMMEFNLSITFPTAPLLTVILALVGIEAIMSEFFNDNTTAFYVILIVWFADQYDAICCHTSIAKRHWLKFFYLYHFVFYAYQYRFNGQYNTLNLVVHWLFVQHSMIYFFHHYELPAILHQAQFQQLMLRSVQRPQRPRLRFALSEFNLLVNPLTQIQLRGRLTQLLSAVRPSATTQTSNVAVSAVSTVATSTVATSTSTITSAATRNTVTVGTNAQPINTSQSIQTVPASVETAESQTSSTDISVAAVSIQTNDEGTRPPHGGPDQP